MERLKSPKNGKVVIGIVGKYTKLKDSYISVYEALSHGAIAKNVRLRIEFLSSEDMEGDVVDLSRLDGILVPGGFGERGVEGKVEVVRLARENKVPYLGLCLGMQCAVIEYARNVCGLEGANSTEFDKDTAYPIISLLEEQRDVTAMGASMRLGAYSCKLIKNSLSYKAYKKENISERHRHRYEFNNKYKKAMERKGLLIAGKHPQKGLVEIVEVKQHPWFVACQFHPEFKSKPDRPHPLFRQFISAALAFQKA